MARKKRRSGAYELDINMTPMIDIVFQLLIFFVLTAKFITLEGELLSYLPKDRGQNPTQAEPDANPVIIFLQWKGDIAPGDPANDGKCVALTNNYEPEAGGTMRRYEFQTIQAGPGAGGWPPNQKIVNYNYPDFAEIEGYMAYRKARADQSGRAKLPVTINFENKVPIQMVVNMLDICQKVGITDFSINAQGLFD